MLNYTTGIEADKTVSEIQKILVTHGASAVLAQYDTSDGSIICISFQIVLNGTTVSFKLPTDWRPVLKVMENHPKVPRRLCTKEQALRVGWRIIKDWIAAQMAIVETRMVTLDQVFLPYAVTKNGQTFYEHVQQGNLLTPPADTVEK